mmetsp:Transcript_25210/g.72594  ORF Transcript_25210/g.72594 Transcript_25210/m.72594 type:complete len:223 (-) Transcript_25210:491-1159(-)
MGRAILHHQRRRHARVCVEGLVLPAVRLCGARRAGGEERDHRVARRPLRQAHDLLQQVLEVRCVPRLVDIAGPVHLRCVGDLRGGGACGVEGVQIAGGLASESGGVCGFLHLHRHAEVPLAARTGCVDPELDPGALHVRARRHVQAREAEAHILVACVLVLVVAELDVAGGRVELAHRHGAAGGARHRLLHVVGGGSDACDCELRRRPSRARVHRHGAVLDD